MKYFMALALLAVGAILFSGCGKDSEEKPYIIFKDAAGEVITDDNIPVALNSTYRINAEMGYLRYTGNNIDYDWKIDDGAFTQYSAVNGLNITTLGSFNNLRLEKATMDVTFGEDIVSPGSHVTVRVKDQGSLSRTLTFVVE